MTLSSSTWHKRPLDLVLRADAPATGRQFLSTALFAAEAVESFETLTGKADPGQTDGEAVSRVWAFKLAPEIDRISAFSGGVAQQWWADGQPDFVNDNSQNDQPVDGNGSGVMFLLYLTNFLGIPLNQILAAMPATNGAPLGQTYVALLTSHPELAQISGPDGPSAFQAMVTLLEQNATNPTEAGTCRLMAIRSRRSRAQNREGSSRRRVAALALERDPPPQRVNSDREESPRDQGLFKEAA